MKKSTSNKANGDILVFSLDDIAQLYNDPKFNEFILDSRLSKFNKWTASVYGDKSPFQTNSKKSFADFCEYVSECLACPHST